MNILNGLRRTVKVRCMGLSSGSVAELVNENPTKHTTPVAPISSPGLNLQEKINYSISLYKKKTKFSTSCDSGLLNPQTSGLCLQTIMTEVHHPQQTVNAFRLWAQPFFVTVLFPL
jgi:hypothetical protein